MALEIEDDAFFADLSKQIAMLIMDDEEEFPVQCPPLPVQEFPYLVPQSIMPPGPPYNYEVAYRSARESKGTGVFIPRSTAPRRKNRSGRSNSVSSNSHKQQHPADKSATTAIGQEAYKSRLYPNYYSNSSLLKRH